MGARRIQRRTSPAGKALRAGVVLAALAVALLLPATALATAPTATTQPASNITSTSAFLNGTVNAMDKQASWHFDYAAADEFGTTGTYTHSTPGATLQLCASVVIVPVCVPILERSEEHTSELHT